MEKSMSDLIETLRVDLRNVKSKTRKGQKETDHLFVDDARKVVYYAELKSNLNLDTEKSKITREKVIKLAEDLKKLYPEHTIRMFLVGLRYWDEVPKTVRAKYGDICVSVNEYFKVFGLTPLEDEKEWAEIVNYAVNRMFHSCG